MQMKTCKIVWTSIKTQVIEISKIVRITSIFYEVPIRIRILFNKTFKWTQLKNNYFIVQSDEGDWNQLSYFYYVNDRYL